MNPELEAEIIKEVPQDDSTSIGEKMLLYWLIRELKPKNVIETGTHRGLTTLYMAAAIQENGEGYLTTCDPNPQWNQTGNFRKFPELEKLITFKEERGADMLQTINDIDFAFIDGFHGFIDVIQELESLLPRLAATATVVFHDCWYGNTDGVNEALESAGLTTTWLPTKNAIRIYTKHAERPTGID